MNKPATKKKRKLPSFKTILAAAERMDGTGYCRACGAKNRGVEPDCCDGLCGSCGDSRVFGAEELVLMFC